MIPEDPELATKLAELRTMQAAGTNPRVAELVSIEWPAPDGPIYYGTRIANDLLDNEDLLERLDGPIELRLGSGVFLDILNTAGISDDKVDLDFWDGDNELTRLTAVHGAGIRVEVFYYFPDVDLLVSEWWGHWQPPAKVSIDLFKGTAESGFRASNLPLPSRAFFTGCQAVFGGLLTTQAEVDEGDCPYNAHLGEPADGADPDYVNNDNGTVGAGGEYIKTSGGFAWNCGASHSEPVTGEEDVRIRYTILDGFTTVGFFMTDSPRSGNENCHVCLQHNPTDNSVSIKYGSTLVRANASTWAPGNQFELVYRVGSGFKLYKGTTEIVASGWSPPSPAFPLYLGLAVMNEGSGVSALEVNIGDIGASQPFGLLDPATSEPFTSCPRNTKAACIARLGDDKSFLAFDTIINSHVVSQTKGPNITVTSRGNETNLRRPLRVIAGRRHVSDLDLLTFVVEPNTNHPDQGSVKCLFACCEGAIQSISNGKINGATIGPQHLNYRTGEKRQGQTSFNPQISNYSGTALFLGVAQGNFNSASADDLRGEADIEGSKDVRVYSDTSTYTEQYTAERGWWLLHCFRTKRWGYGLDAARIYIPDFLDIAMWGKEIVSVTDKNGNTFTGQRTTFNAELIERTAQQQINDICLSGRFSLPFPDKGKLRVVPLRMARELFSAAVFTDKAFFGALDRPPTNLERSEWFEALLEAREESTAALLLECQTRMLDLFNSEEYLALTTTDEEFITDCYQTFLRREPDPSGFAFWLNELGLTDRDNILDAFKVSIEFVDECTDRDVPLFTDSGDERNVCWENGKTTLTHSIQPDADLPNRIVINFDDATKENKQIPLTFEDVSQQLRAGRAFGDTSRRTVEREYTAFGVTDEGEAARLGNLILDLGEFDEGGLHNNLRVNFTTWYLFTVNLHKYQVIRVASNKLDVLNDVRVEQGLEPFNYFRIRSLRRLPNLKVEVDAQAYPVEYYERLELLTQGPGIPPSGSPIPDPEDPDFPGPTRRPPFDLPLGDVNHNDDQILFKVGTEPVVL